ncbi:MAG TPA: L-threonylcarbamoyladenylate synthase [Bacteroidales bacterium]|nr:L-threonylcarbamoyladenylate synthase [Bacteroidales bacterium]
MIFDTDIENSSEILKSGGVILYPTDTIWGIGCDATIDTAVEKIYSIKMMDRGRSLIILVNDIDMLEEYVEDVPQVAYDLLRISDTPTTIIYPDGRNLASGVCSEDGSVGVRICHDKFCVELIKRLGKPLISTSANISGEPFPANFSEIEEALLKKVDYVVKYRQEDRRKNFPSPVIKIDKNGAFKIIRM